MLFYETIVLFTITNETILGLVSLYLSRIQITPSM